MRKLIIVLVMAAAVLGTMSTAGYASDYQGKDKDESIFQKLGDFITGKYEVRKGQTLKEVGVVQCVADRVREIKTTPIK